jgi:hypothetical protein
MFLTVMDGLRRLILAVSDSINEALSRHICSLGRAVTVAPLTPQLRDIS